MRKRLIICRECCEPEKPWLMKNGVCWYCRSFIGALIAFIFRF